MKEKLSKLKKQLRILFWVLVVIFALVGFILPVFFQAPFPVQLVGNTWCSLYPPGVQWQFEGFGSFRQQTTVLDMTHTEAGKWGITYSEDGERVLRIIWNKTTGRETQKQFFRAKILGTSFLTAQGDFPWYGGETTMLFYHCS